MATFQNQGRCFAGEWVVQGHFALTSVPEAERCSRTLGESLSKLEGRALERRQFPTGASWRTTLYWGDEAAPNVGAQYVAHIFEELPMLLLGVSVEKGLDAKDATAEMRLRPHWDWHHLRKMSAATLARHVSAVAAMSKRDVFVHARARDLAAESWSARSWVFDYKSRGWTARSVGRASAGEIVDHVAEMHGRKHEWVNVLVGHVLSPQEASELTLVRAARTLHRFAALRSSLRGVRRPHPR
jgi:hypothetical protein